MHVRAVSILLWGTKVCVDCGTRLSCWQFTFFIVAAAEANLMHCPLWKIMVRWNMAQSGLGDRTASAAPNNDTAVAGAHRWHMRFSCTQMVERGISDVGLLFCVLQKKQENYKCTEEDPTHSNLPKRPNWVVFPAICPPSRGTGCLSVVRDQANPTKPSKCPTCQR